MKSMEKCIYVEVEKQNEKKVDTRKTENFLIHSKLESIHIKHI